MTPILLDFARKSGFTLCKEESALREMLEQFAKFIIEHEASKQPDHEPIAWATMLGSYSHVSWGKDRPDYPIRYEIPLYTQPPKRKPLTDEQIESLWDHGMYVHCSGITALRAITRAIEAAHGITGEQA
jgi:hypothetical protein